MVQIGVVTNVTTTTTRDGGQLRRKSSFTYGVAPVASTEVVSAGLRVYVDSTGLYIDTSRPAGGYPLLVGTDGALYIDTAITGGGFPLQTDGTDYYIED